MRELRPKVRQPLTSEQIEARLAYDAKFPYRAQQREQFTHLTNPTLAEVGYVDERPEHERQQVLPTGKLIKDRRDRMYQMMSSGELRRVR